MLLEDMLAILGRVGTVKLRKGTNDRSATPGHTANTEGWVCELQIAGYLSPFSHGGGGSPLYLGSGVRPGLTATEAAKSTLDELERFLDGPRSREARKCYEKWGDHRHGMRPEAKIEWSL